MYAPLYANATILTLHARRLAAVFALVCAISAFCYGVFLLLAVERTASLAKTTSQIQSEQSSLSMLENQYLLAESQLTPQRAQELGFITPKQESGVFATNNAPVLTFNNVGR